MDKLAYMDARFRQSIIKAGHSTSEFHFADDRLPEVVAEMQPDLVLIRVELVQKNLIDHIQCITKNSPLPIIVFCTDDDSETIREAVEAGVSSYIVDGTESMSVKRLESIIDVALVRFEAFTKLRTELEQTRSSLRDRKTIEQAKGLLMKLKNCSESEAYQLLRKSAMNSNQRMIQVATALIGSQSLLQDDVSRIG